MKLAEPNNESDRAATHYELGIPDGFFGGTIEVDATKDGLEFGGGYSILPWSWIFLALSACHKACELGDRPRPSDRDSRTANREPEVPS